MGRSSKDASKKLRSDRPDASLPPEDLYMIAKLISPYCSCSWVATPTKEHPSLMYLKRLNMACSVLHFVKTR